MTVPKLILFRGMKVVESWPAKVQEAQQIVSYTLSGNRISRIPFGREQLDFYADRGPCHDCQVLAGEFHVPGCDVEECPVCGDQLAFCACPFAERR